MENRECVFNKVQLIKNLGKAVETFLNRNDLTMKINESYNLNIVFNKDEFKIDISETKSHQSTKNFLEQAQKKINSLTEEIAKLKNDALQKDKQLKEKTAELKFKVNSEIPKPIAVRSIIIDETPDNLGWTVIQCRKTGHLDFITESYLYNKGFGDSSDEYWIGSEALHKITKAQRHELYIAFEDTAEGKKYARYDNFLVGSLDEKYRLKSLGNYSGDAGDALRDHENQNFEFYNNCNGVYKSFSWWTASCFKCNLNGNYGLKKTNLKPEGFWWGALESLRYCKMSIRPI
nr:fibroleukin-like [Drosophila takahashii]